jgi:site-specific recombinase XerD
MFEELFNYPAVLTRHLKAPLVSERRHYLAYRARDGTSRETLLRIARELLVIVGEMDLNSQVSISVDTIESAAERWARRQKRRSRAHGLQHSHRLFSQVACDWLQFLGRLKEPEATPATYATMIQEFSLFMRSERGLSEVTIHNYIWYIRKFLYWFYEQGHSLDKVTVLDVDTFVRQHRNNWSRVTSACCAKSLRAFFRYAERRNWCTNGIAEAIESPRIFKQEALPAGFAWDNVQKLIASTDGDRPRDIRDRAILMLLSIYGFRSGEIANLRLEDLDWEREIINVYRSKQRITQSYPLTYTIGTAILRYLKQVRPRVKRRNVFITLRAPFRPISASGMYHAVSSRLSQLGIRSLHRGPHTLRHACAVHLVSEGFSLKEIGDHLGHRSAFATRIYAKVDLAGLREVANFYIGGVL